MDSDWLKQKIHQHRKWAIFIVLCLNALLIFILYSNNRPNQLEENELEEWVAEGDVELPIEGDGVVEEDVMPQEIYIDIKGAVKDPGVYQAEATMRIVDALDLAGGLLEEADSNQLNLATKVVDQMVIYVPIKGEETNLIAEGVLSTQENGKININTGSKEELMTLNGIGEKKAESIIQYREENGSFSTIEDIKNISGIGEKTFENLKEEIETGN